MLSHQIHGSGPPLLLIHGFGISFPIWQGLAPLLAPYFRLIMIELPGIGHSPPVGPDQPYLAVCAQEIEALRHRLDVARWSVLAYSSGTRAAEAYIRRDATAVESAVLLCPAHVAGWRWQTLQVLSRLDARLPSFGVWALTGQRLQWLVQMLAFNGRRRPEAGEWTAQIAAQPVDTLKTTLRAIPRPSPGMLQLPVPTLYIWGDRDVVFPRPRRLSRDPRERFVRATHSAPQSAAEAIAGLAIPFLQAQDDGLHDATNGH
jgi:pimeloyl-ACP methyl ester carboxylesterase